MGEIPIIRKRADLHEAEVAARHMGRRLKRDMPHGWGFTLILASLGEEGFFTYISSIQRADNVKLLREAIPKISSGDGEFAGRVPEIKLPSDLALGTLVFLELLIEKLRGEEFDADSKDALEIGEPLLARLHDSLEKYGLQPEKGIDGEPNADS